MSRKFRSNVSGKKRLASLTMAALWSCQLLVAVPGWAAPTGGVVTNGAAVINQSGNVTDINQSTQAAAINWQGFSIGANETVNFNQPNASSVTLNRVVGNEASVINGALNANGQVFLVNSNGILFSKGSSVNTAGFVASTLDISDEDFSAGKYIFKSGSTSGSVINMGTITVADGGYVGLLGSSVSNQGVIVATKGTVALAAGSAITLNFNGDSMVSVTVDEGVLNALVENKQAIYADGGTVILTAKAAEDLLSAQVNNTGIIQARTVDDLKGTITLLADGGATTVDGTLDASAPTTGDGGFIETSGDKVHVADTAVVTTASAAGETGTWLIDPDGFVIGTGGDITGSLLSSLLDSNNIAFSSTQGSGSDGDIDVNAAVSWSADTTLTLTATNDVNVNAAITASGANAGLVLTATGGDININNAITLSGANAGLTMTYAGAYNVLTKASYSGTTTDANGNPVAQTDTSGGVYGSITFTDDTNLDGLVINGTTYTLVHSMSQLDALDGYDSVTSGTGTATTLSGYYAIAENLDAAGTTYTTAPIALFSGTLAGLGHTVSNLTINANMAASTTYANFAGLIGQTPNGATAVAVLRDIGLEKVDITSKSLAGSLLALSRLSTISGCYATGAITSTGTLSGGLVGSVAINTTAISYCYADVDITSTSTTASQKAGGLVGGNTGTLTISNSHASGDVTLTAPYIGAYDGDLVGPLSTAAGGLVGYSYKNITVDHSYATGNVSSAAYDGIGGLIGYAGISSTSTSAIKVTDSFATGAVTGFNKVGGLIGYAQGSAAYGVIVDNCYATGEVKGTGGAWNKSSAGKLGGLIGWAAYAVITNSHATGNVISALPTLTTTAGNVIFLSYIGGLVGFMEYDGAIDNCYATGDVIGQLSGSVTLLGNNKFMGGLVGASTEASITNSYATGDVLNGYSYVGGLVGNAGGDIINCWASGNVSGWRFVGGLAGASMYVTNSAAYGNVTGIPYYGLVSAYIGGLVGGNYGLVDNCTAIGDVTGGDYVGALVGSNAENAEYHAVVSNSSATGSVSSGDPNASGGLIGNDLGTVTNSTYHDVKAEAAARQAAFESAAFSQSGSTMGQTLQNDEASSVESGVLLAGGGQEQSSIDDHIVYADSNNYGAHIKSVSVDGVEYNLENDEDARSKKK